MIDIREKKSTILCITNHVVMNFTANVLLSAVGRLQKFRYHTAFGAFVLK